MSPVESYFCRSGIAATAAAADDDDDDDDDDCDGTRANLGSNFLTEWAVCSLNALGEMYGGLLTRMSTGEMLV